MNSLSTLEAFFFQIAFRLNARWKPFSYVILDASLRIFLWFSIHLFFFFSVSEGLKLLKLDRPPYALAGHSVSLECQYDLQGDSLYAVKWFKENAEIYRYVPQEIPPKQTFPLPGINVQVRKKLTATCKKRN